MELHEKVAAVREQILERGFGQGQLFGPNGEVCLRGAIALLNPEYSSGVDRFLNDRAAKIMGSDQVVVSTTFEDGEPYDRLLDAIVAFNDSHTEQEVLAFLDEAEIAAKELTTT